MNKAKKGRLPVTLRPWKTTEKQTVLRFNRFLTVESHTVELPDGQVIPDWAWVIIPDAAIVLPVTAQGQFLCFQQTKYAIEGCTLAPVGGMLEPGETPLTAAQRELREEMGCEADQWISLASTLLDPNRGIATMHLFLALDARQVAEPVPDDLEDQQMLSLNQGEIEQALSQGEFKVAAWALTVALSLNYLRQNPLQYP
jgi:8-oxo-dGTP pyrophosphatase MutT (NUDIX family)